MDFAKIEADVEELKKVVSEIVPVAREAMVVLGKLGPAVSEILAVVKTLSAL